MITRTYPGRVKKTGENYYIKLFIFKKKQPLLPLVVNNHKVLENDVILCTFDPAGTRGFYKQTIAHADTALAHLYTIVEKNKITIPYPDEVMEETATLLRGLEIDDPSLTDLRDKAFITIDNEGSRDLDQALYIEKTGDTYHIYYALADGGFYIKPKTHLFAEALRRGSTFYFPGFAVPMLPQELSEGILSLNPDVDRRAFVFLMDMGSDGEIRDFSCFQGRIHSRAQLTYNEVQIYYDQPSGSRLQDQEYTGVLDLLKTVGEIRIEKARQMNRVHFNREEPLITVTNDGTGFHIAMDVRNNCSRYNEQLSLMCNMAGAAFLVHDNHPDVQGIYRIHQEPSADQLQELAGTIDEILLSHGITDKHWQWSRGDETLADFMDRLYTLPGKPGLIEALERQVLLTMRRSMFSSAAGEHYALAVNPYSRFSSPMREIVGIFLHKEALEKLGVLQACPCDLDKELREKVIDSGNRSRGIQRNIERQVTELAADWLFSRELTIPVKDRTRYCATILGVKATRLYIRLDAPPLELKVYTKDLETSAHQKLDYDKHCLISRNTKKILFKPGDELVLYVSAYRKNRWRLIPDVSRVS